MNIAYARYFSELEGLADDARSLLAASDLHDARKHDECLAEALERVRRDVPLRLVLTGEWNAGKSSLISALTGAEVKIDADVCTTANSVFEWQGITIVDTPGVQAENQGTDHDRLARDATVGADLVLFVITNELFNPRLANYLHFVLDNDGLGLASKTCLVVNKMDREENDEAMLLTEIQQVLGPHQNVQVLFCSAGKFLTARTGPPELAQRFVAQSRMDRLAEAINQFVDDAGAPGRLVTPLQIVADVLDMLQETTTEDPEAKKHLELIRRQRLVLQGLQQRLLDLRKEWKQTAYSTVMRQAEPAVGNIASFTTAEDLEALFSSALQQGAANLEQLHDSLAADLRKAIGAAEEQLEAIGDSPLARDIETMAHERARQVKVGFSGERPGGLGGRVVGKLSEAGRKPLKEGLEAASQNPKALRDAVLKVGKVMGKRFRPWEATKTGETLAKLAGKAGKAMPVLMGVLDLYLNYREEKVKEEQARHLARMRMALRNAFADQARVEAETLEAAIVDLSSGPVSGALGALDSDAAEIAAQGSVRLEMAKKISAVREHCTALRSRVMAGAVHSEDTA